MSEEKATPSTPEQIENDEEEEINQGDESKVEVVILEEEDLEEEDEAHDDTSACVFTEHSDSVFSIAFCKKPLKDGTLVFASGGGDDKAVLYHLADNTEPKAFQLTGHTDTVGSLAFSADGTLLVTGGLDGICIVWDTTDGHEIARLTGPTDSVEWVGWHPSLPAVIVGDRAGLIWMYSAKIGKCVKVYTGHNGPVTCGSFRSDGSEIWSAGEDQTLRIWAPKSGQATTILSGIQFHQSPITCGSNNRNGAIIATGDESGIIKIMRCDQGKIVGQLDAGENSVEKISFSYDDQYIAVASLTGTATIWSPNDLKMRHALPHPGGLTSLAWHPKKPYLVTACVDGAVRVWDVRNGVLISEMYGHRNVITDLDVFFDGKILLIVTSSEDHTVRLWAFDEENPIKPESNQEPVEEAQTK